MLKGVASFFSLVEADGGRFARNWKTRQKSEDMAAGEWWVHWVSTVIDRLFARL